MMPAARSPQAQPANKFQERNPWFWVPSLYFSQGIPYVIVMTMSVVMYKRLGITNTDIALYTSWLYLPWVLKPLWSPLVDITRTKRFWVVSMQFLVSCGLALAAMSVQGPAFFRWSLGLFWVMAFASATHDIAADGFYMLSLSKHEQAWWVGLRSTFYRTAMIVGAGLLVVLAGVLESKHGLAPVEVSVQTSDAAQSITPKLSIPQSGSELHLVVEPDVLNVPLAPGQQTPETLDQARAWNRQHGFIPDSGEGAKKPATATSPISRVWSAIAVQPLQRFLTKHFPRGARATTAQAGNVGVLSVSLSAPPPAGRPVVVDLERKRSGLEYVGLARGDKGFRLVEGERFIFTPENWNAGARAVIQLDPKIKTQAQVAFVASSGDIPRAWSVTLFVVAGLFLVFSMWHSFILPRPAADEPVLTHHSLLGEFFATLGSFFQKPGVVLAVAFILLYRFDEAQLGKVISPFLLDQREAGGLALTTSQVGLAYGTFGILALTCGGLLGGFLAARYGLKTMLPYMVVSMYLPKLAFVCLSWWQPENFLAICGAIALEQFGYGFGFTAFMLYLLYFADGPHKTAHYAICTGFMALGMMIPGMWSGWVADQIGYRHFFVWVICSALPGFALAMLLKIDPQFGKKTG